MGKGKVTRRQFISRHFGAQRAAEFDVSPGPLAWLVDLWQDAGVVKVQMGPMGGQLVGLGWPEMVAWLDGADEHDLAPIFRRAIMQLSAAYASTAMAAQQIECEVPYDPGKA